MQAMKNKTRNEKFAYLTAAILGLLILAVGLPGLQLLPGQPIPGADEEALSSRQATATATEGEFLFSRTLQVALIVLVVLVCVSMLVYLIRRANLRKDLFLLFALIIGILAVVWLTVEGNPQTQVHAADPQTMQYQQGPDLNIAPIGEPPQGFLWLVIGFLLLSVFLLMVWLLRKGVLSHQQENGLGREAGRALRAIEEGQDLHDVILRCYQQMIAFVKNERGIEREESLTPREFEEVLTGRGIPVAPIRQLTRLFELVRYGDKTVGAAEKNNAIQCMIAIREACLGKEGAK